jgi:hypothetical protein
MMARFYRRRSPVANANRAFRLRFHAPPRPGCCLVKSVGPRAWEFSSRENGIEVECGDGVAALPAATLAPMPPAG